MNLPLREYVQTKLSAKQKMLSLFLTAGFPQKEATLPLLRMLDESGADLIELGMPFSDPLADGPVIQHASHAALQNGMTVAGVLEIAARAKTFQRAPMILMGYYNPILKFGIEAFVRAASNAGVLGLIIPDLPPEESMLLREHASAHGVSLIYLVSPNTSAHRLKLLDELTTSFIYAVSITGVTGARSAVADQATSFLQALRQRVRHPVLVGFGVATREDAARLAASCEGVIVGSALLQQIEARGASAAGMEQVGEFIRNLREGLQAQHH